MRIMVTGLCSLHWGRLEYGNIGNYYITEPLFRELHRVFPSSEIVTTFQMTDEFVKREDVTVLPLDYYYAWREDEAERARSEHENARHYLEAGEPLPEGSFISEVLKCDLVLNMSGDMWGDNAEHVGRDRFLVDLYKMRTAQILGVKTVLFAGTPGPFSDDETREFAKEVFANFTFVPNREPNATRNLMKWGFDMSHVKDFACPAFLFEPAERDSIELVLQREGFYCEDGKPLVGMTVCGYNMPVSPYDVWPRDNVQYEVFAKAIEHMVNDLGVRVMLVSHTNGFTPPPQEFKLINGRDFAIVKQLQRVVRTRGIIASNDDLRCVEHPCIPKIMKAMIGTFDMFVTGRLHASVAAISQCVPTVFIMHGKEFIRSTKIQGFASIAGVEEFVCEPYDSDDVIRKIDSCWEQQKGVRKRLGVNIPLVQQSARDAFDAIAAL